MKTEGNGVAFGYRWLDACIAPFYSGYATLARRVRDDAATSATRDHLEHGRDMTMPVAAHSLELTFEPRHVSRALAGVIGFLLLAQRLSLRFSELTKPARCTSG